MKYKPVNNTVKVKSTFIEELILTRFAWGCGGQIIITPDYSEYFRGAKAALSIYNNPSVEDELSEELDTIIEYLERDPDGIIVEG
jgi:hypothetical protein